MTTVNGGPRPLLLCDDSRRAWTGALADKLAGVGCPSDVIDFRRDQDHGWAAVFETSVQAASAIVLVRWPILPHSAPWQRQRDAALLVEAAGRVPVITALVDRPAPPEEPLPGSRVVLPSDIRLPEFTTALSALVGAIRQPFRTTEPSVMVIAQTDEQFDALATRLVPGGVPVRYLNRRIQANRHVIVANSTSYGSAVPPVEMLAPGLLVLVGNGLAADTTRRIVCHARHLVLTPPPASVRMVTDPVMLIAAGSTDPADGAVALPLPDAAAVDGVDVPMLVLAAFGVDPETLAEVVGTVLSHRGAPEAVPGTDPGAVGLGDRPSKHDSLDRMTLARALVKVLQPRRAGNSRASEPGKGPTVVSLEAPWGAGKSSMFHLIEEALEEEEAEPSWSASDVRARPVPTGSARRSWARLRHQDVEGGRVRSGRKLTVRTAARWLRMRQHTTVATDDLTRATGSKWITVRFNPWSHLVGEEVWAGLSASMHEALVKRLCHADEAGDTDAIDDNRRERYWFRRNIPHLDRRQLALMLYRRIGSPLFKISLFALLPPILAQVVGQELEIEVPAWGPVPDMKLAPFPVIMLIGMGMLLVAAIDSATRYIRGRASTYLPSELFHAPVLGGALLTEPALKNDDAAVKDPVHRYRSGQLAARQRTFREIQADIEAIGCELVVFVDDLDRCSPRRTALVFEAINDFLSGEFGRARFILAVDAHVVAAHLQSAFTAADKAIGFAMPDDPQIGWTFLRKLIQLPVLLPAVSEPGWRRALSDQFTTTQERSTSQVRADPNSSRGNERDVDLAGAEETEQDGATRADQSAQRRATAVNVVPHELEANADVQAYIVKQLMARPNCTIREMKRLLNVWHLFVRLLCMRPSGWPTDEGEQVATACDLVTLAEIVTRWPAFQARLHAPVRGRRGLEILADAANGEDIEWRVALHTVGLTAHPTTEAYDALRTLLRPRGQAVARLANAVL